jgi:hypothetical protein
MTRGDQMKKALKLLMPADRAACTKYIEEALDDLEKTKVANQQLDDIASKESRKALDAYSVALRKAQNIQKRLPDGLKQILGTLGMIGGQREVNFGTMINDCERVLAAPHAQSRKDYVKINAAAWAKNLLNLLGIDSPLTHDGKWPALAAILHGDGDSMDLFHHCSEYNKASRNSGPK